jgi:hypothetical protein
MPLEGEAVRAPEADRRHQAQVRRTKPARKVYHRISGVPDLVRHLQWALCVELSTIPPYLCALYSVIDRTTSAAALVRSVVVEEMLHMALVSNLMNSIGARPSLTPEFVPLYPSYIPHHAAGGPYIQLQPLSPALARSVFMAIEQPEPGGPHTPAEGDEFHTIGQFYKAIEGGFETCADQDPRLFANHTGPQRSDTYFGGGGGELVVVDDLKSARRALSEITEQGEGAPPPRPPAPGEERYGDADHYGPRPDGTYGPIIGTPWELSHYRKFKQLADGDVPVPATYPMQPNPAPDRLDGSVRGLSDLFDGCYTLVLQALERSFTTREADAMFFAVAYPVMQFVLPALATLLMRTPLELGADPDLGPTAGPAFVYRSRDINSLLTDAQQLLRRPPDRGTDYRQNWAGGMQPVVDQLQAIAQAPAVAS